MVNTKLTDITSFLHKFTGGFTGQASKHSYVEERIAHKSVSSMNSTSYLTCDKEAWNGCISIGFVFQTTILIVKRRINQHREFRNIYSVTFEEDELGWKFPFNGPRAFQHFYHRRIQPNSKFPFLTRDRDPFSNLFAFTNDSETNTTSAPAAAAAAAMA